MRIARVNFAIAAAALLLAGCVSTNPNKLSAEVHKWVPLGTPEEKAEHIMTRKGFDCSLISRTNRFSRYDADILDCGIDDVRFHEVHVEFIIENSKVARYGEISVDDVLAK